MFVWTPELEALCPPLRNQGTPIVVKKVAGTNKVFAAAKSVTGYTLRPSLVELLTTGTGSYADEADAYLLACSVKVKLADLGVDGWFQRYGAAGAVEIFCLLGKWTPTPLFGDGRTRRLAAMRVRQHLAHARDYQAALDFVLAHDGLPHGMPQWKPNDISPYNTGREVIAFLFPDHRPFFETALAQLVERSWVSLYLLGAVASIDDVTRLGQRISYPDWDLNAVLVARTTRDAGLAPLAEYTARSTTVLGVAHALTAYVSPEGAAVLAQYAGTKAAHPILRAYFTAHPELATAALEPLTSSKTKKLRAGAIALLGK